ncbi:MAG TPA: hypothetical protein VGK67_07885 [Myxococcales bacterium]|jgi:Tfp pilus assembly protein PilO
MKLIPKAGIAIALAALLGGSLWLARRPSAEAERRAREQESRSVELENAKAHLAKLRAENEERKRALANELTAVPSDRDGEEQPAQLRQLAQQHHLTFLLLRDELAPMPQRAFQVGVEGPYLDLMAYLRSISELRARSTVRDLRFEFSRETTRGPATVRASFTVAFFHFRARE